ncbi:MAG: toll/interleukin-1 receptor domain-containing protein, partial [Thermoguttaceae bacterium]|nr:toll/interleukin-1 receptor domain-containing protein [Thermoguttaceae bacterium]
MPYDYDYFISYAHKDNKLPDGKPGFVNEFVEKLKNGSEEHKRIFGGEIRVFFDESEIHDMSDWDNKIRASLASSRFLIVLLSPNYFKSEYCAKEFDWWMKHEMHRCTLGEGTAPMIISNVGVFDPAITPTPDIPADIQVRYPNWLSQIQTYQSRNFDMHDFLIAKIDDVLKTLRDEVKDKVRRQNIVDMLPYDTYPGYNENFVGRRENLLSLRDYITTKTGKVITALTGLGGFGKTELALTYGHAFGWDYQLGRFFKPCENCSSIYGAFLSCGIQTKYGWELKGTDEEQLLALFNNLKLEQNKIIRQNTEAGNLRTEGAHMLLILDNVSDLDLISQLLKLNLPDFIHVIITTRENTSDFAGVYSESVERLSEDESVELLNNLRLFDNPAEAEAARKIAQLLAGYTLIVELTGKYLYQNRKNPRVTYQSQYERLVKDHAETFQKMADKAGDLTRHAAETVSAVMESTLAAISDNTRKALKYASLMAPDAVALSWLPELCGLNEDEEEEVLDELTGYSLLAPLENEPNIARIHRLVAETVKQEIPEKKQMEITAKIQEKCNELLLKDITFWCSTEHSWNITPVFEFCLMLADNWTVEDSEEEIDWNLTWMLGTVGNMLNSLGKMNEAKKAYQRWFEICKERADAFPSYTLAQQDLSASYNNLGDLERAAGNAVAAREWYEKDLEISKRLAEMMPDNVSAQRDLSVSYDRLGNLEDAAGNAAAAREWYEKALEISKRLAEQMPDDVLVQRDLSISYNKLGNLE